jgi:carbamoylphosphate synthase large subunit
MGPHNKPLVLVLSGRRTAETLRAAGYRVGLAARTIPWDLALAVDVPIEVDLDDWDAVVSKVSVIHQHNPISAVVTQLEGLVPLAGRLRGELGLETGITEEAALNCLDKAKTLELLRLAGVPVARSRIVRSGPAAMEAAAELGLPVVAKPRDGVSAAGLMLCDTADAAASAVQEILDSGRDSALVEEFLEGAEIMVFACRSRGTTTIPSCLDYHVGPPPKFVKTGADHPSRHFADRELELTELTDAALAAVGLDNWVATVQIMLTAAGPRVVEINPRVPGGQLVALIAGTAGVEPTQVAAEAALGRTPQRGAARAQVGWYRGVTFEEPGRAWYQDGIEAMDLKLQSSVPPLIDIDVASGDEVLPINHPRGGVFGRIVLCGADEPQVRHDYEAVMAALELRLEPTVGAQDGAEWRPHSRCC